MALAQFLCIIFGMSAEDRYQRVNLRIPKELHARIMEVADARSHSMNAEIIQRLEQSLRIGGPVSTVKSDELNPEESLLIKIWRAMDIDQKLGIMAFLKAFIDRSAS